MRLSKDDILKAPGPRTEIVPCPEWGGEVAVRGMTGTQRDEFELASMKHDRDGQMVADSKNLRARIVAWCVVDEDTGERLFTNADVEELGRKGAGVILRIAGVASRLSGLGEDDVEELAEAHFDGPPKTAATPDSGGSSSTSSATSAARRSRDSSPKSAAGN